MILGLCSLVFVCIVKLGGVTAIKRSLTPSQHHSIPTAPCTNYRMIFAVCAIAVICLMPVSNSSPLTCEELVRPSVQQDLRQLVGGWAVVAVGLSHQPIRQMFKQSDSVHVNISSSTNNSFISYKQGVRLAGKCHYNTLNAYLEGSIFTYSGTDPISFSLHFVRTACPDCMLIHASVEPDKELQFYLISRRRELEQKEMEEFSAQVECLNLPRPVVMDPTKELCPGEAADNLTTN